MVRKDHQSVPSRITYYLMRRLGSGKVYAVVSVFLRKCGPAWQEAQKRIGTRREILRHAAFYPQKIAPSVQDILKGFCGKKIMDRQTKIMVIGCCFAQQLQQSLLHHQYRVLDAPWGLLYHSRSIRQALDRFLDRTFETQPEKYWVMHGEYFDPYRNFQSHVGPVFLGRSIEEADAALQAHHEHCRSIFMDAEVAFVSLGLTETFRRRDNRATFCMTPCDEVYDPHIHEFYDLSYQDVLADVRAIVDRLKGKKILLSVSPVALHVSFREGLGGYIADRFSKSILQAVVYDVIQHSGREDIFYFPAYEIGRSDTRRHLKKDGRHVNGLCMSKIIEAIEKLYVRDL